MHTVSVTEIRVAGETSSDFVAANFGKRTPTVSNFTRSMDGQSSLSVRDRPPHRPSAPGYGHRT